MSVPIWLTLTRIEFAALSDEALREALRVRDEQVVADDLHLVADLGGEGRPALPVVLGQRVLDGDERVVRDEVGVVRGHVGGGLLLALERVRAVLEELGGGDVERERDVLAGREAGLADRLDEQVERLAVAREVRREAALVAEAGGEPLAREQALQHVVGLGAPAEGLAERLRADRQDHELLDVDVRLGVRAAVDDVHHRHRQHVGVRAADVAEERQLGGGGGGLRDGEADAEDRVRAEVRLVLGAVGRDQGRVDDALVGGVDALDGRAELVDDGGDGLLDALAAVALLVAVAQLVGLERAGGGAGGDGGAGDHAVLEQDLDLDGRVAARVQDLAGVDGVDGGHGGLLCSGNRVASRPPSSLVRAAQPCPNGRRTAPPGSRIRRSVADPGTRRHPAAQRAYTACREGSPDPRTSERGAPDHVRGGRPAAGTGSAPSRSRCRRWRSASSTAGPGSRSSADPLRASTAPAPRGPDRVMHPHVVVVHVDDDERPARLQDPRFFVPAYIGGRAGSASTSTAPAPTGPRSPSCSTPPGATAPRPASSAEARGSVFLGRHAERRAHPAACRPRTADPARKCGSARVRRGGGGRRGRRPSRPRTA